MHWYPGSPAQYISITRGDGAWLADADGRRYLDATSSGGTNLFGHCHPLINDAVAQQLAELANLGPLTVTTHPVLNRLAERLVQLVPPGLDQVLFLNNRAEAIGAALTASCCYWQQHGDDQRTHFLSMDGSDYHQFAPIAGPIGRPLEIIRAPSPDCSGRAGGDDWESHCLRICEQTERILSERHDNICSVIVEPLVQCSGTMQMHHPIYLSRIREACDRHNVHLIADETSVGFGRTGSLFASEQANASPDFLCLGPNMCSGYFSLTALLAGTEIAQALTRETASQHTASRQHQSTHILACRAALAVLDIFEQQATLESNQTMIDLMATRLSPLHTNPNVVDVRQTGAILAIELADAGSKLDNDRAGRQVMQHGLNHRVLLQPVGNVIYLMPPYVCSPEQIMLMIDVTAAGIEDLCMV